MYENVVKEVAGLDQASRIYPGGLCEAFFTPIENVFEWPVIDPVTGIVSGDIVLKPGSVLYTAQLNPQTQGFDEKTQESNAGRFHPMEIKATLPGNSVATILTLATLIFHRHLVVFEERDGLYRFLGDEDSGAELEYDYTSGDNGKSRNRNIKFTWSHPNPAPIFTGDVTISGGGAGILTEDGEAILTEDGQPIMEE
jgi:hypothetical protein